VLLKLAGSACSGKTTVARACTDFDDLVVHDFDELRVPSTADTCWRQRALEEWIQRTLSYQRRGCSVLLTGQSPLGEVLACPSAPLLEGIAVCLLDLDDAERVVRLDHRNPGRWNELAKQGFLGWAQWHRDHAADPRARPEVITVEGWDEMRWHRWLDWSRDDPRWNTTVISTTGRRVEETARTVEDWIATARTLLADGHLSLGTGWA
jgi:hypothetical protein